MNTTDHTSLDATLSKLGLKLNTNPGGMATIKDGWECIQFHCQLMRDGKPFWTGEYSMGLGHVKLSSISMISGFTSDEANLFETLKRKPNAKMLPGYEHVKLSLYTKLSFRQKLTPTLRDVVHSLLLDGEASFSGESFEDWCSTFGYDTDSRKAEETWRACVKTGSDMRKALSMDEIRELQEAFSDY